jgi:IS1 family transposase
MGNFCRLKKNKVGLWTAVDHLRKGILGWFIGKHSVFCGNYSQAG